MLHTPFVNRGVIVNVLGLSYLAILVELLLEKADSSAWSS